MIYNELMVVQVYFVYILYVLHSVETLDLELFLCVVQKHSKN
jgi:hypothetical protein